MIIDDLCVDKYLFRLCYLNWFVKVLGYVFILRKIFSKYEISLGKINKKKFVLYLKEWFF